MLRPSSVRAPRRITRKSALIAQHTKRRDGRRHNSCSPSSLTPGSANCANFDLLYTEVAPKDIFAHLQAGCTGQHALDLLALHNEMQRYHLKVKGNPEYINMLKDAQRQAGREGRTIAHKTLLLFAGTDMLTSEHFPRANDYWGERAEIERTWPQWKYAYR